MSLSLYSLAVVRFSGCNPIYLVIFLILGVTTF